MSQVILPRTGILSFMDDESRQLIATYGSPISTMPGQILIKEGESNTHLYVVISGTYNVSTAVLGSEVNLDIVGVGDCLGEVAIFNPDKASATVRSIQLGRLWSIDSASLQEFLLDWPNYGCAAILGINIMLSRRLKRANEVIKLHQIVPSFLSVRAQKRVVGAKLR